MASGNFKITYEIEPFVQVKCLKVNCIHNLYYKGDVFCNLKNILVDENGNCSNKEDIRKKTEE